MSEASAHLPTVPVTLLIDPAFAAALPESDPLRDRIRRTIRREVAALLETLGLPGQPSVEIRPEPLCTPPFYRFIGLRVHDRECRFADDLLLEVYSMLRDIPLEPTLLPSAVRQWLLAALARHSPQSDRDGAADFFSETCLAILKEQPEKLLGGEQTAACRDWMPTGTAAPAGIGDEELFRLLGQVLARRVGVADRNRAAAVITESTGAGHGLETVRERLLTDLKPAAIEIRLHPDYLRQLTREADGDDREAFAMMRDGLFYELGMRYPAFRFVADEHLRPHCFAFRINHLTTPPRRGLARAECLVDEPAESLGREGFPAIPIVNPANRKANSIIPRAARAAAGAGGRQTWSPLGYLVLALAAELRTHSANLLDGQLTTDALARLETAFPDLVRRARAVYAIEPLTAVLRHLLQEQISIRDLRGILERLLDFDVIVTDQRKYIAFDDRLPTGKSPSARWRQEPVNLAAFVRTGMKNYISHKYTRGQRTLIVYLLAPDIEQRLEAALENERGLPQETADGIRRAVRTEIGTPSPDAAIPALLTTINVRAILRRCIAAEFPRLPVLAYQELSPVLNVQPIARLTLS